jgi:hypothetical protein
MRVGSTRASRDPADIEVTLASAFEQALPRDYRLLGVIVAWLEEHHARVNVPRLGRVMKRSAAGGPFVLAFWAAIGHWLGAQDARWRALERLYVGETLDLDDAEITAIQLQRAGVDPRFAGSPLRVHAKLLRSRAADVIHYPDAHSRGHLRSYLCQQNASGNNIPVETNGRVQNMTAIAFVLQLLPALLGEILSQLQGSLSACIGS